MNEIQKLLIQTRNIRSYANLKSMATPVKSISVYFFPADQFFLSNSIISGIFRKEQKISIEKLFIILGGILYDQ